ncbi:YraN family protein [Aliikangiella maris]|uniref:UPF0102 protein ABVT42_02730 n=2 Tax=Aliikangiella maris TaxID=3162458 RepID=A0ABV2BQ77_9GAMM
MQKSDDKRTLGFSLEVYAKTQIESVGYQIVATNYACKLGEIDIIAKKNNVLVFIEVRYRKNSRFGGALASITPQKQKRLILTASHYLQQKKLTNKIACRFDVFAIQGNLPSLHYEWIENAFTA